MTKRRYVMVIDQLAGLGFSRAYWTLRGAERAARQERRAGYFMVFVVDAKTKKAWANMPAEDFNRDVLGI